MTKLFHLLESKKIEIQRRLYRLKRHLNQDIDASLASLFENCLICQGRSKICTEFEEDGNSGY